MLKLHIIIVCAMKSNNTGTHCTHSYKVVDSWHEILQTSFRSTHCPWIKPRKRLSNVGLSYWNQFSTHTPSSLFLFSVFLSVSCPPFPFYNLKSRFEKLGDNGEWVRLGQVEDNSLTYSCVCRAAPLTSASPTHCCQMGVWESVCSRCVTLSPQALASQHTHTDTHTHTYRHTNMKCKKELTDH